jgi:hypothetical protein
MAIKGFLIQPTYITFKPKMNVHKKNLNKNEHTDMRTQ